MLIKFTKQLVLEMLKGNFGVIKNIRYYSKWKRSLKSNSVADEHPCLTYPAVDILNNYINSKSKVFEYGGGGSTLYFVKRAAEVVTVEHNDSWYEILKTKISGKNWNGVLIKPVMGKTDLDPSDPENYTTWEKDSTYHEYVSYIDRYPDGYFDIIMIDGRSRPSCIKHSLPKLKAEGLLIVDDIYRNYYLTHFEETLKKDFTVLYDKGAPVPFYDFFAKTGIWLKH